MESHAVQTKLIFYSVYTAIFVGMVEKALGMIICIRRIPYASQSGSIATSHPKKYYLEFYFKLKRLIFVNTVFVVISCRIMDGNTLGMVIYARGCHEPGAVSQAGNCNIVSRSNNEMVCSHC